jgi:hypothetical protein
MARNTSMELFCTGADALRIFADVEAEGPFTYALTGLFTSDRPLVYDGSSELPSLGTARHGETVLEDAFMVVRRDAPIAVRTVPQRAGGMRYAVDPLANPDSVVIKPGGHFGEDVLIAGQMGGGGETPTALWLGGLFRAAIRHHFRRFKSYWVGPEAEQQWKAGVRLTHSVKASRLYDLTP